VRKPLFATGKKFIHIHPGRLPDYRGSTTIYYSLLAENKVEAPRCCLMKTLNAGPVIGRAVFEPPADRRMIDGDYDPNIRASLLVSVLRDFVRRGQSRQSTNRLTSARRFSSFTLCQASSDTRFMIMNLVSSCAGPLPAPSVVNIAATVLRAPAAAEAALKIQQPRTVGLGELMTPGGDKFVVFFAPEAGVVPHYIAHCVVAKTLEERGHRTLIVRCFDVYPRCVVMDGEVLPHDLSAEQRKRSARPVTNIPTK